jgi:hypothetical protein
MKVLLSISLAAIVAGGSITAQSEVKSRSGTIVVEYPSDLPGTVRQTSESMCLHATSDGRTFLYIEQDKGRRLAILNVTEPSSIRVAAVVPIEVPSAFDFVRAIGDSEELIRYRDNSGFALLNLRRHSQPLVSPTSQVVNPEGGENLGENGLLLTAVTNAKPTFREVQNYEVIDTANKPPLTVLAQVQGVTQEIENSDTGTVFLLNGEGLTVIRQLDAEDGDRLRRVLEGGR